MDYWNVAIIPLIIGALVLIIEYWIIQPLKDAKINIPPSEVIGDVWPSAMRRAVSQFKKQQRGFSWFGGTNSIVIDSWDIGKKFASMTLSVTRQKSELDYWSNGHTTMYSPYSIPQIIAIFELLIDQAGNIKKIRSLPLTEYSSSNSSTTNLLSKPDVRITNLRKIQFNKLDEDFNIITDFEIENNSSIDIVIRTYVEIWLLTIDEQGAKKKVKWPIKYKKYKIPAQSIISCHLEYIVYYPNIPLDDMPCNVWLELD